nr:seroreactive antigen 0-1-1 76 [Babesia microti]
MANEVKGAIEEVNKIIDVLVSNIRDSGYVIDNYIISSFKSVLSIINKIAQNTNVSNVIIPGLKALTLSVFLILTIA